MSLTKSQTNIAAMQKFNHPPMIERTAEDVKRFNDDMDRIRANSPMMSMEDEITNLRAERDALAERLRQSADLREVIGHLRAVHTELQSGATADARSRIAGLLRRIDRESEP